MKRIFFLSIMVLSVCSARAELLVDDGPPPVVPLGLFRIDPASINQKRDPALAELARKLVEELNAPTYAVRKFARQNLIKLGRAAIEPLEFAARSEDSETRMTAISMLIELRGRGFLGVGMLQNVSRFEGETGADVFQPTQVSLNMVQPGLPAELAGIMTNDVILELNGQPVSDINDLQREVITTGPGRVLSATVLRGDERIRVSVALTINMMGTDHPILGYKAYFPPVPPINLEAELPPGERVVSNEAANAAAMQFGNVRVVGQGRLIINGQVITSGENPNPAPKTQIDPEKALKLDAKYVEDCERQLIKLKQDSTNGQVSVRAGEEEAK